VATLVWSRRNRLDERPAARAGFLACGGPHGVGASGAGTWQLKYKLLAIGLDRIHLRYCVGFVLRLGTLPRVARSTLGRRMALHRTTRAVARLGMFVCSV